MSERTKILAIDDDQDFCADLRLQLEDSYDIDAAPDISKALSHLHDASYDLILLDIKLPGVSGLEALKLLRDRFPTVPIIMVTGNTERRSIIETMKTGASDYITKGDPGLEDELRIRIDQVLRQFRRNRKTEAKAQTHDQCLKLVGDSIPIVKLASNLRALRGQPTSVLLTGESGSGKEVVAHFLNAQEADSTSRPMVEVNCAAIPEALIESELFGHEKGSFTGAIQKKAGLFLAANGGDIFLDEIGELPLHMQAKLLRVLQEKKFTPIGATKSVTVDVRIIAATNRDLRERVQAGLFREDLYYRLSVITLTVPPLRERVDDIPLLAEHFFKQFKAPHLKLSRDALAKLGRHPWPGNVRALRNCLERAWIKIQPEGKATIDADDLEFETATFGNAKTVVIPWDLFPKDSDQVNPEQHRRYSDWTERAYYEAALGAVEKNKTRLAEQLLVSRNFIHGKLKSLGLSGVDRREVG